MAAVASASILTAKSIWNEPPRTQIRFRVLREGNVTNTYKRVRLIKSWNSGSHLDISLESTAESGHEFTGWLDLPLQTLVDQAQWVVVGIDDSTPALTTAKYMVITPGETHLLNISSGNGATTPTDSATISATVRVADAPAMREVVVVEKDNTGAWRVAGHGESDGSGSVVLPLEVVGGAAYALGVDDFGVPFTPLVAMSVGQRIRPSAFVGVLYEITEAGNAPSSEPAWWPITTDGSRALGTARAVAVRYFQPIGHGPITVELT